MGGGARLLALPRAAAVITDLIVGGAEGLNFVSAFSLGIQLMFSHYFLVVHYKCRLEDLGIGHLSLSLFVVVGVNYRRNHSSSIFATDHRDSADLVEIKGQWAAVRGQNSGRSDVGNR